MASLPWPSNVGVVIPHPLYTSDLATSDFGLFPNMNPLCERRLSDDKDFITELEAQLQKLYNQGNRKEKRWQKYIVLWGEYIKKVAGVIQSGQQESEEIAKVH